LELSISRRYFILRLAAKDLGESNSNAIFDLPLIGALDLNLLCAVQQVQINNVSDGLKLTKLGEQPNFNSVIDHVIHGQSTPEWNYFLDTQRTNQRHIVQLVTT